MLWSSITAPILFITPIPRSNHWVCLECWIRNLDRPSSSKWELTTKTTTYHNFNSRGVIRNHLHTTKKHILIKIITFHIYNNKKRIISHLHTSYNFKLVMNSNCMFLMYVWYMYVCVGQESGSIDVWRFQAELHCSGWWCSLPHHRLWDTAAVWTTSAHRPAQSYGTSLPHCLTTILSVYFPASLSFLFFTLFLCECAYADRSLPYLSIWTARA